MFKKNCPAKRCVRIAQGNYLFLGAGQFSHTVKAHGLCPWAMPGPGAKRRTTFRPDPGAKRRKSFRLDPGAKRLKLDPGAKRHKERIRGGRSPPGYTGAKRRGPARSAVKGEVRGGEAPPVKNSGAKPVGE